MRLRFHGAAQEVTGSMHLIEANGQTIALDCGLFQGKRREANRKNVEFPVEPSKIDAVVLSHAHIDHCGKLPRLIRDGFNGPIYATRATRDLAEIMLADSAHIQEEDAAYWNKKRVKRGDEPIEPLYTSADAEDAVRYLVSRDLDSPFDVVPGIRATFQEAGHMLGSAGVLLELDTNGSAPTRLFYTGDCGRAGMEILRDPAPMPECDYLISESTYGGRHTPDPRSTRDELAEVINRTVERGGKVVVPSFAVGRTQVLVYDFHLLIIEGRIPRKIPLIVDSPLAVRATEVFRQHPEVYDREAYAFNALTGGMLDHARCEYTQSVNDSKALHGRHEPMIIVSASGMCEVGRILHHLKNNIEDPRNTILIVGYQAAHTLGRRIVEKQKRVKIFGEMYDVKARVKVLNGFSSHADAEELARMTAPQAGRVKRAFLVHGELDQSQALAGTLRSQGYRDVVIPEAGQSFNLNG
jgi:metallo-beta-lactamase family protein